MRRHILFVMELHGRVIGGELIFVTTADRTDPEVGHAIDGESVALRGLMRRERTIKLRSCQYFARAEDRWREDFTRSGKCYDLILDSVGNRSPSECRRVLTPMGICVMVGAPKEVRALLALMLKILVVSRFVSQKFPSFMAKLNREDLTTLHDLMKDSKVTPVIDRQYKWSETAEAVRYAAEGHTRGKVVVTVEPGGK